MSANQGCKTDAKPESTISLGNLSLLCRCVPAPTAMGSLDDMGLPGDNPALLPALVESVRPLRNAVAHNQVVFDARFSQASMYKPASPDLTLAGQVLESRLSLPVRPAFNSIVDYMLLVALLRERLSKRKRPSLAFMQGCTRLLSAFELHMGVDRYMQIVGSGDRQKLARIMEYLRKV